MTAFPLTPNKKIDRHALRSVRRTADADLPAGMDDIDRKLLALWTRTLQMDGVCSPPGSMNFFESGGHSLRAIRLLNEIRNDFNVKIPLKDFFLNPTFHFLNDRLSAAVK